MIGCGNMLIRLVNLSLENFKCVKNGEFELSNKICDKDSSIYNPDILGFYGQNGSGKSSGIEALAVLKALLSGSILKEKICEYMNVDSNHLKITASFLMMESNYGSKKWNIDYCVILKRRINSMALYVAEEEVAYSITSDAEEDKQSKLRIKYEYKEDVKSFIIPNSRMVNIISLNKDNLINLNVLKKECYDNCKSYLFHKQFIDIVDNDFKYILQNMANYAQFNIMIVNNFDLGLISLNYINIKIFGKNSNDHHVNGTWFVELFKEGYIEKRLYEPFSKVLNQINLVINSFIPDFKIDCIWNESIDEKGNEIMKYEFLSIRDGRNKIPLRCESDGIKKLISICNGLISFYNEPSFLLAIDEFDSGIFEYLLGEILEVLKSGSGQLIFTAHNLRPLEVLDTKNIILTTTDENERYIKYNNLHPTNNPRDKYLRYIFLGDYKKPLYLQTQTSKLSYALRKAGQIEIK